MDCPSDWLDQKVNRYDSVGRFFRPNKCSAGSL